MQRRTTYSVLEHGLPVAMPEHIRDRFDIFRCDIIGDVHGCFQELTELLAKLGHGALVEEEILPENPSPQPEILFVGDLVDRGDRVIDTLRLVVELCEKGYALAVLGNHDYRFMRWLQGNDVTIAHGLEKTIEEFLCLKKDEREHLRERLIRFFEGLPYALRFDRGKGVMVHAAWRPRMKEETDPKRLRYYAIFGPTTGERTPEGFPVRIDWAKSYKGPEFVFFGHQVYLRPYRSSHALGIDTGCVFGGSLTAVRYPSMEIVSVKSHSARAAYNGPVIDPEEG